MKKILLLFVFVSFISFQSNALAVRNVTATSLEYYNFSSNTFSISGFQINVGANHYDVNSLSASGPLVVPAGGSVTLTGLSIPAGGASIGLWSNGTFPGVPNATQLWNFMQFGSGGQEYEAVAVTAGLWQAGAFVSGTVPLTRDADYSSWGPSHWTGSLSLNDVDFSSLDIKPNPFSDEFVVSFNTIGSYNVELINIVGQTMFSRKMVRQKEVFVNTSLLESGVYLLRISTDGGDQIIKRVVKNE